MDLLSLGVLARSRKENERRLAIHPLHLERVDASLRSKSVELTILGASTPLTESSAVLVCRKVAFPAKSSPCSFPSSIHAVTVPIKHTVQTLNYAGANPDSAHFPPVANKPCVADRQGGSMRNRGGNAGIAGGRN